MRALETAGVEFIPENGGGAGGETAEALLLSMTGSPEFANGNVVPFGRGSFFAVHRRARARVCNLGMRAAIAYLVMASAGIMGKTASAEEHWPGSYIKWPPRIINYTPPDQFSVATLLRAGFRPYEKGQLFRVDPYGGYLFKSCEELAEFINDGKIGPKVIPIRPWHVVRALQLIPENAGLIHDEKYGDGFLMMAYRHDPMPASFSMNPITDYARHPIIRKSASDRRRWDRLLRRKNELLSMQYPALGSSPKHISCD